jgi:ketosteroid isomerase-like protein
MSENLDLVRSIYTAAERGDFRSAEWADPEIEYVVADGPEPGTWTGLSGMADYGRRLLAAWEAWSIEAEEFRELNGERVLVLEHHSGRGRASGLEVGQVSGRGAAVFHIQDGKVVRQVVYWDRAHALADLGLAE